MIISIDPRKIPKAMGLGVLTEAARCWFGCGECLPLYLFFAELGLVGGRSYRVPWGFWCEVSDADLDTLGGKRTKISSKRWAKVDHSPWECFETPRKWTNVKIPRLIFWTACVLRLNPYGFTETSLALRQADWFGHLSRVRGHVNHPNQPESRWIDGIQNSARTWTLPAYDPPQTTDLLLTWNLFSEPGSHAAGAMTGHCALLRGGRIESQHFRWGSQLFDLLVYIICAELHKYIDTNEWYWIVTFYSYFCFISCISAFDL